MLKTAYDMSYATYILKVGNIRRVPKYHLTGGKKKSVIDNLFKNINNCWQVATLKYIHVSL